MYINELDLAKIEDALFTLSQRDETGQAAVIAEVCQQVRESVATDLELQDARHDWAGEDDISIQDNASTSNADEGFWIEAWLWVPHGEDRET